MAASPGGLLCACPVLQLNCRLCPPAPPPPDPAAPDPEQAGGDEDHERDHYGSGECKMEQRLIPTAMHQTGDEEWIGFRLHPLAMTDAIEPHQDAIPAKVKPKTRSRAAPGASHDASACTSALGWCGTGRLVRHASGAARFPCHPGGVARNRRRRELVSERPKKIRRALRGWHVSLAVGFMDLATRRLTRKSPCARVAEPPAGAFDYLLREPLHRRQRWIRGVACIVLIGVIACAFSLW